MATLLSGYFDDMVEYFMLLMLKEYVKKIITTWME
jgi:hypothetical protein